MLLRRTWTELGRMKDEENVCELKGCKTMTRIRMNGCMIVPYLDEGDVLLSFHTLVTSLTYYTTRCRGSLSAYSYYLKMRQQMKADQEGENRSMVKMEKFVKLKWASEFFSHNNITTLSNQLNFWPNLKRIKLDL